jgi:hypothetical protein
MTGHHKVLLALVLLEPIPGASLLVRHPRATDQEFTDKEIPSRNEKRKAAIATNAALAASHSAEKADNATVAFDGATATTGEPVADDMLEEQVLLASSEPDEQVEGAADQ